MSFLDPQNPGISFTGQLTIPEITLLQDLANLAYQRGDILYYDGTQLQRLPAGTAGYVLQTGGPGADPSWGATNSETLAHEAIIGTQNGINTVFTVAHPTLFVTVNGQVLIEGDGFSKSALTLTFDTPLLSTDVVHNFYSSTTAPPGNIGEYIGLLSWITYD